MENVKYLVVIQCDLAHRKCSGFACTNSFYDKTGKFEGYNSETKYISFTCGGCCGKSVSAKLDHFVKRLIKNTEVKREEIAVHLASCMTTDNYHYDRCPHIDYIKNIVKKRGFVAVEGSYLSKGAHIKREKGVYKTY